MIMEDWTDKVIGSLSGLERAKPPVAGFGNIQRKLAARSLANNSDQGRQWMAIAAVILMIVSSNVVLLSNYLSEEQQSYTTSEYPDMITSYNIYDNE